MLQRADCMARAEEVMHQVEQRAEKMEKLRRELEELMQPVDGVAEARGRERSVASRCQLVEAIQQLGYLPRQGKNSTIEEKHLAVRLIRARKADLRTAWAVTGASRGPLEAFPLVLARSGRWCSSACRSRAGRWFSATSRADGHGAHVQGEHGSCE